MPVDVELFSISAGGVPEPRADWTEAAQRHLGAALHKKAEQLGVKASELSERDADDFAEISALHAAVARAIEVHHMIGGRLALPTKAAKLDWSLGEAVMPVRERSGADYALFVWMRDSYASAERKAAMVIFAVLGVALTGGTQTGYASLVDLRSGQVMWFNRLARTHGDLRDPLAAEESLESLLNGFPGTQ
jgi:hypothetical protein